MESGRFGHSRVAVPSLQDVIGVISVTLVVVKVPYIKLPARMVTLVNVRPWNKGK